MCVFQAKGNGDFCKLTFIRVGGWGRGVGGWGRGVGGGGFCLVSFPISGPRQSPLKQDITTQLAPAGVSTPACLGCVGFVQPELSSYTPPVLQGQAGGHPSTWLVVPSAQPTPWGSSWGSWATLQSLSRLLRASCGWDGAAPQPWLFQESR